MSEVTLTRAECEALEHEARSHLEALHARERADSDSVAFQRERRRSLRACANLLAELEWARRRWRRGEWTVTLTLGPEIEAWLAQRRGEIEGDVHGGNGGERGTGSREDFLLGVLDRLADETIAA